MKSLIRQSRVALLALFVLISATYLRFFRRRSVPVEPVAPKVLLIGAYGNGNYGDDIIGQALARGVEAPGSVLIAARLEDVSRLKAHVAPTVVVGGGLGSLFRTWKLARETDIAVLGGGGLLEGRRDDVNVHRLILEYLGKLAVCGLKGQRMAIHGIGVSPDLYSNALVNSAVRAMFRAVDVIGVRDPASQAAVNRAGGEAFLIRDPAIVLFEDWARIVVAEPGSVGVVLLDHHRWPSFTPGDSESELERKGELTALAQQLVLLAKQRKKIKLFNFHWSDVAISSDVMTLYLENDGSSDCIENVPYEQSSSENPFRLLMACEEVWTMRFHPALAALTSGAKVSVIGRLQKLEQLRSSTDTDAPNWSYPEQYDDPLEHLLRKVLGTASSTANVGSPGNTTS